jgi:hypothetical protein
VYRYAKDHITKAKFIPTSREVALESLGRFGKVARPKTMPDARSVHDITATARGGVNLFSLLATTTDMGLHAQILNSKYDPCRDGMMCNDGAFFSSPLV